MSWRCYVIRLDTPLRFTQLFYGVLRADDMTQEETQQVLDWSQLVKPKLEPAGNFESSAKVMSEMGVRAVVILALAEYGISPRTTE